MDQDFYSLFLINNLSTQITILTKEYQLRMMDKNSDPYTFISKSYNFLLTRKQNLTIYSWACNDIYDKKAK